MEAKQSLLKVLICDDDPADLKLVRAHLRQIDDREIALLEARDKAQIQSALDKGSIDVILMDIQMPEKSGTEWLREIVERQLAPVVMLTGHGSEEVAVQSLKWGAVDYLSKNRLSTETLAEAIDDAILNWRQMQQSKADQEDLERMANSDALTKLHNKQSILRTLDEQMKHAKRYQEPLGVIMLDIDHFREVNNQYGHIIGDDVLEKIAYLVRHTIRDADIAGRYGGEEFLIVLPQTDLSSAMEVAERIRKTIETAEMTDSQGSVFGITVSQGLASYRPDEAQRSCISRADKALYEAKAKGRNRVECDALGPSKSGRAESMKEKMRG